MTDQEQVNRYLAALDLLDRLGTKAVGHSGRTLFQHLIGTHRMLEASREREAVCLAGLFHSIYGTNIFKHQTLDAHSDADREAVQKVIGAEAEALAHMFCTLQGRPQCFFRHHEIAKPMALALSWRDLTVIELANLLEQGGLTAIARYL